MQKRLILKQKKNTYVFRTVANKRTDNKYDLNENKKRKMKWQVVGGVEIQKNIMKKREIFGNM